MALPLTDRDSVPLQLRELSLSFAPGVPVLDGVSLDVEPGSTLALLGPSGCGKTTLLSVIAGLEHPDAGTVRVGDRVLTGPGVDVPPEQRHVGMVFQDWALFGHLDVALLERLCEGGEVAGRVQEPAGLLEGDQQVSHDVYVAVGRSHCQRGVRGGV
jgi:ABC-type polar amino acid transport system ATPase subunit